MIALHRKKPNSSENGIALAIAMLVLLLVSTVVAGMIVMSNSETNTSANFRDEQTAFFASRAGLEEVRDRVRTNASNSLTTTALFTSSTPANPLPGQNNGILYITNPLSGETVAPWNTAGTNYPDNEICFEVACTGGVPTGSPWYTSTSASTPYAATPKLAWKWVRLMPKINRSTTTTRITSVDGTTNGQRVCWNGANEVVIANTFASCRAADPSYYPVYSVTSLAATASGSRRMTQYEITPAGFPNMPAAMVFDGASPSFSPNPNSNAFGVTGTDANQGANAGVGCGPAVNQPGLGGFDNLSTTSLQTQVNRPNLYGGSPAGISNVSLQLGSGPNSLGTVDGLTKLVNTVTSAADPANIYGSNPTITNMGSSTTPVINVVNGDLTLSGGSSGTGILLVTGTLTLSGNPSYNGIILVIGKGNVVKNGGGNGVLNGSLFVANLYGDPLGTYTNLIPLGTNHVPGIPSIAWNGGGNATIQYDSCWINLVTGGAFPLQLLSMRELIYR
jgi:Tfp pilus assembly protein PilX